MPPSMPPAGLTLIVRPFDGGQRVVGPLIKRLGLSDAELEELLAFLDSLTGSNADELVSDAYAAPIVGR